MCTNQPSFYEAITRRRSVYEIGQNVSLPDSEIESLVAHSVKFGPSPYNSQSGRAILLLASHHEKLWDLIRTTYQSKLPPEAYEKLEPKFASYLAGYGTILFFEDQETVKSLQQSFPRAKETFPLWSLQASGMLQYSVWVSLEAKGLGASLQHYHLAEEQIRQEWSVPPSWSLISQMPFGSVMQPPGEKTFLPLEERLKVFK